VEAQNGTADEIGDVAGSELAGAAWGAGGGADGTPAGSTGGAGRAGAGAVDWIGPSSVHEHDEFVIMPYIAMEQISTYATRFWQPITPYDLGCVVFRGTSWSCSTGHARSKAARWATALGPVGAEAGPHAPDRIATPRAETGTHACFTIDLPSLASSRPDSAMILNQGTSNAPSVHGFARVLPV
jgi:hypothetical protein